MGRPIAVTDRVAGAILLAEVLLPSWNELTPREKAIVARVAAGLTNRDIAWDLHLSPGTVKNYLSSALWKLGVHNRTQAAVIAMNMNDPIVREVTATLREPEAS
jgi:two-component system response regulator DesR